MPERQGDFTPLQERFVEEFSARGFVGQAAALKAAGSKAKGKNLDDVANRLVNMPHVKARIAELQAKAREIAEEKFGITIADVVQELGGIAFSKDVEPSMMTHKVRSLELLGKHLGMFGADVNVVLPKTIMVTPE